MPFETAILAGVLTLTAAQTAPTTSPAPQHRQRQLDGDFGDWDFGLGTFRTVDKTGDAVEGAADVRIVAVTADDRDVWVYLRFAKPVTLQGLDRPLRLAIEADGQRNTGASGGWLPGADFVVLFSPTADLQPTPAGAAPQRSDRARGEGVLVRRLLPDGSLGAVVPAEAIGLGMAPAHASEEFEIRIARPVTTPPDADPTVDRWFRDLSFGAAVTVERVGSDEKTAVISEALESTEPARALLPPIATAPRPKAEAAAVARAEGTAFRAISWNAERGALFARPEPFVATLRALAPDVVLFQELGKDPTAESLAAWMNEHLPPAPDAEPWRAVVSGGDLRTAVVANRPLTVAPFLDGLTRVAGNDRRTVRVAAAIVDLPGGPLLAASLHLKCCGRLDSEEDRTRRAEAEAIQAALAQATERSGAKGLLVGGDFNLVGSPEILARTGAGLDGDGSGLDPVAAYRLDRRGNATWRSAGNTFLPGRLDWLLISSASLESRGSFVFDAAELSPAAREALRLPASAAAEPSDHLPVVVDLAFRPPAAISPAAAPAATPAPAPEEVRR
jgi:endonuclease/exonuclease/phosphatase family metal-dependent hydrolase